METEKYSALAEAIGLDLNSNTTWRIVHDIVHSLSHCEGDDDATKERKISAALQMVKDMKPEDAVEAQMIGQLVCAHIIATESVRHAIHARQAPEGRVIGLKLSAQFMTVFRDHMRALEQYRVMQDARRERRGENIPNHMEIVFVSPQGRRAAMPRHGESFPAEFQDEMDQYYKPEELEQIKELRQITQAPLES